MKTATALIVMAVGAVFAFAVDLHFSFLNLQAAGWILILRGRPGWSCRSAATGAPRQLVLQRGPDGTAGRRFPAPERPPY